MKKLILVAVPIIVLTVSVVFILMFKQSTNVVQEGSESNTEYNIDMVNKTYTDFKISVSTNLSNIYVIINTINNHNFIDCYSATIMDMQLVNCDVYGMYAFKVASLEAGDHVICIDSSIANEVYGINILNEDEYINLTEPDPDFIYNHTE